MLLQPPTTMAPTAPQSTKTMMSTMVLIREGMIPGSIAATRVMLTHTPEGNVPGNLRETGPGLQLTEEDWIPSQLSILNLTISLQMILSHKQAW